MGNLSQINLNGRRIFLTGGTGFVGKSLLDAFIVLHLEYRQEFEVLVLSRDPSRFLESNPRYANCPWLSFQRGDLMSCPLPADKFTDVIHAAADSHFSGSRVDWVHQIVEGTRRVLDFAERSQVKRFLNISSGAVYGGPLGGGALIREDNLSAPSTENVASVYGQAKRLAEQLLTIYVNDRGLAGINARCFAFSGRYLPMSGAYALGNFVRDAIFSDAVRVKGTGSAVRSYLDAQDMAVALLLLLQKGDAGQSYNVGSSRAISILDLAHLVVDVLAPHQSVIVENSGAAISGAGHVYVPCTKKLESLGFVQETALEDSIRTMAHAYKSMGFQ